LNSKLKKLLFYIPAAALGAVALALQNRILTTGYDAAGLLIPGNPALPVLWGITGFYALAVLALLPRLGADGTYADNFPKCGLSGTVMVLSGCLIAFTGINQLLPGQMGYAVLTIAAGVSMGICGVCRMLGKKPVFVLDLTAAGFFVSHVLRSYGNWNANPHIQRYAFPLLAGVAVLLFTVHRARCAAEIMDRRKMVFMGFLGIYLCLAALSDSTEPLFFLGTGLWCAGGMCELKHLTPPEPEELPAEDASLPEEAEDAPSGDNSGAVS
jgi:hypothetical protein